MNDRNVKQPMIVQGLSLYDFDAAAEALYNAAELTDDKEHADNLRRIGWSLVYAEPADAGAQKRHPEAEMKDLAMEVLKQAKAADEQGVA